MYDARLMVGRNLSGRDVPSAARATLPSGGYGQERCDTRWRAVPTDAPDGRESRHLFLATAKASDVNKTRQTQTGRLLDVPKSRVSVLLSAIAHSSMDRANLTKIRMI